MKKLFVLLLLSLSLSSWAQETKPGRTVLMTLADVQKLDAINAEADAIKNSNHLKPKEFGELLVTHGGKNKGEVFLELELNDTELIALAAATSLGLIVFENDQQIMDYVQEHKDVVPQGVEDFGNFVGSRAGIGGLVAGSYFLGVVLKNNKLKKIGLIGIGAQAASNLVAEIFKRQYGRSRPIKGKGPYDFYGEGKSFFSGHTVSAFSLATVVSEVYGKEYPVVPYLAYGLATVVAYSRMRASGHWASDVLAGAVAGILITKIVYHYTNKYFKDKKGNDYLSFHSSFDYKTKGINVHLEYVPKSWR